MVGKAQKSHGTISGPYGGCSKVNNNNNNNNNGGCDCTE
jgi:hypothetical protein